MNKRHYYWAKLSIEYHTAQLCPFAVNWHCSPWYPSITDRRPINLTIVHLQWLTAVVINCKWQTVTTCDQHLVQTASLRCWT